MHQWINFCLAADISIECCIILVSWCPSLHEQIITNNLPVNPLYLNKIAWQAFVKLRIRHCAKITYTSLIRHTSWCTLTIVNVDVHQTAWMSQLTRLHLDSVYRTQCVSHIHKHRNTWKALSIVLDQVGHVMWPRNNNWQSYKWR